eukprot:1196169-Prorocentrum_minimum.AAC.3
MEQHQSICISQWIQRGVTYNSSIGRTCYYPPCEELGVAEKLALVVPQARASRDVCRGERSSP